MLTKGKWGKSFNKYLIYNHIKHKIDDIPGSQFTAIVEAVNDSIMECVLAGSKVELPRQMGSLSIFRREMKEFTTCPDWVKMKAYFKENGEWIRIQKRIKVKYFLKWNKGGCFIKNIKLMKFMPTQKIQHEIVKLK